MTENIAQDPIQRLEQAFGTFNQMSGQLEDSYRALERRVSDLTQELEASNKEREHQTQQAEKLAKRLELLLDTLPAGVVVIDGSGYIHESNPAAEQILNQALKGRMWLGVAAAAFPQQSLATGDCLTKQGKKVSIFSSSLVGDAGRVLLLTDVTETRALEELVSRNERLSAMGRMAATLAHQIRTPLAGALLYFSQCLELDMEDRAQTLIQQGIDRLHCLDRLVHDMLVFARGNASEEEVRVADIFREVHDAVAGLKSSDSHLIIEGSDVLVNLKGNRTALVAALLNLVTNAFESAAGVVVTLRAEMMGNRLELSVKDNGPGIAPAIQSRVFEPFFSTRPAGTGLGLAVVKTVAEAHGGELALDSEPDRGTRVGLKLPKIEHEDRANLALDRNGSITEQVA